MCNPLQSRTMNDAFLSYYSFNVCCPVTNEDDYGTSNLQLGIGNDISETVDVS